MAGAVHGGAETFFEDLTAAFARAGLDQLAVTRPAPERLSLLQGLGVEVRSLPFGGVFDFYTPLRLGSIARAWKPDVILGWMNRACGVMPSGDFARIGRLGGYYSLKYYRRCDELICNTRDIRDYVVREGWPAARAHYVPNFCPLLPDAPLPRTSFDTPESAPVLLILARLEDVKGIDTAIRALTHVADAVLWIAGEGRLLPNLQKLAEECGVSSRVRFLGWRPDRGALLKAADLCLVPSRHEPFGNVVVNAWVHDVAIVACRSEGPGALIAQGEDGLLTAVDNAAALADAVKQVLADRNLRDRLVAGGRAKAAREYSESAVVEGYLAVFKAAVAGRV